MISWLNNGVPAAQDRMCARRVAIFIMLAGSLAVSAYIVLATGGQGVMLNHPDQCLNV
jgi:hypothetical protein